jgi:hypothetical protein
VHSSDALGHYETTYTDPAVMRFFLDGIRYALGDALTK